MPVTRNVFSPVGNLPVTGPGSGGGGGTSISDQGEKFIAKTDTKAGAGILAVFGDSTGAPATRWPRRLMTSIGADNTSAAVGYRVWDDASQAMLARESVQAGASATSGTKSFDSFSRVAADLRGTTADSGQVWAGASTGAGDYSIDGSKAVRSSDTATSLLYLDSGSAGDRKVNLNGVTISTNLGTAYTFRIYTKYVDSQNAVFGNLSISATGVATMSVFKLIGGTNTSLGTGPSPLTNNTADQSTSFELSVTGDQVVFKVGSTATATGTLSSSDMATLAPAVNDGFAAGPPGMSIDSFQVDVTGAASAPALSIEMYNGSMPGSTLDYQTPRLATMCPVTPDLIFINSSHNYTNMSVTDYLAKLDNFVAVIRTRWPSAGIAVMSQNPQKSPGANIAAHLARCQAISSWCVTKGVGYVPVLEAFRARNDLGATLVRTSDGVHPTDATDVADAAANATASNGAQLWTRAVKAYLVARSNTRLL